ncbi:MAG: response regulator [Limisphaerales bacterium]
MALRHKILLLDDDEQTLELYQELLQKLPSQPEVTVSSSGARAIALLETDPFSLLITDLRMPKMDGLQVLAIVRRKYPRLRIIVLTGVLDEEYRSRAYALGVDLFCQKPTSSEEFQFFRDCIESFLGREVSGEGGFRGMQSKSLVDLIQLECLSQSSSVLHITQGSVEGRIWLQEGQIIDAAAGELAGEAAFREILSWKSGNFELQPADPTHARMIAVSSQGLLLDTAQALDEGRGQFAHATDAEGSAALASSALAPLAKFEGVDFLLAVPPSGQGAYEAWRLENAKEISAWAWETQKRLQELGDKLGVGGLAHVLGFGFNRHWAFANSDQKGLLCAGFRRSVAKEKVDQTMKQMFAKWVS